MADETAGIPTVPAPSPVDDIELVTHNLQVSGLAVDLTNNRCTVRVRVRHLGQASRSFEHADVLLSPPAAARLSRLLDEAVQEYLYGPRKDGQTQGSRS